MKTYLVTYKPYDWSADTKTIAVGAVSLPAAVKRSVPFLRQRSRASVLVSIVQTGQLDCVDR